MLTCCSDRKPYPLAMQQAESCIVAHPDSALIYLSTLKNAIADEPEETRMYYALLTIKANDKLYITHTSDSLIKVVTHFYENQKDQDKLMEAHYYMGSVYRDMKDTPQAVRAFQQAIDTGKDSKRYDLLGRIYEQMGTLFAYQGLYDEGMEAYKTLYYYCDKQEDRDGVVITLRDIARMYDAKDQKDSAIYYYKEAHVKSLELTDKSIEDNVLRELGCLYVALARFDSAKVLFSKASTIENKANALLALGTIYQNASQKDSARYYFNDAIICGNSYVKKSAYQALSKMEAQKGDYRTALDYAYKSEEQADSIKKRTRTEAISKIHSLYNYQHTQQENESLLSDNERKKNQIHELSLVLIVALSVVFWYVCYLKRKKKVFIEQEKKLYQLKEKQYIDSLAYVEVNKQKMNELEEQLLQAEAQKNTLQKELIQLQKELLEISNRKILVSLNEKELLALAFKKSDIYLRFHKAGNTDKRTITEEDWDELQAGLDVTYNNFTTQLYALCPQITELELRICCLIKISVQVKNIANLIARTPSAISTCRTRLYKKIHGKEGTTEMMDQFIADL